MVDSRVRRTISDESEAHPDFSRATPLRATHFFGEFFGQIRPKEIAAEIGLSRDEERCEFHEYE